MPPSDRGWALPWPTAETKARAAKARMKHADRRVTLVRSTRTQETFLWDVEEEREVPLHEQRRK